MNRKPLKIIIKELSDRLLRTTSYDPDRLDRMLKTHQIDAVITEVDQLAIEMENRFLAIEDKIESKIKRKKNV